MKLAVPALLIALTLIVALVALSAQSDATPALPTSDAPFVSALRQANDFSNRPYPFASPTSESFGGGLSTDPFATSAAPTTAPSARVAAGGLPIASRSVLPAPTPMPRHARFLRGQATWWDSWGSGFYAAIRPDLGIPVGSNLTVCGGVPFHCASVPITTTCACLGPGSDRLIDLSRDFFSLFASPSRGVTEVVIEW